MSEARRVEELVDAVLLSTCENDADQVFEAFINCPNLGDAERAMCSDDEKGTQRDKLRDALQVLSTMSGRGSSRTTTI
jgi:hypothetical protein